MTKVMFSVNAGDSLAMVLRTRRIAKRLKAEGFKIRYSVSSKAIKYLDGYLDHQDIRVNAQNYSITKDSQTHPNALLDGLLNHVKSEMSIFEEFKPDIIIGDLGIVVHGYKPDVPILHILNRFFVEIGDYEVSSPFNFAERNIITAQTESVINLIRQALKKPADFSYREFIQPPALINGASYFVDDLNAKYQFSGLDMELWPKAEHNRKSINCFICLGTGLPEYRKDYLSEIVNRLKNRFEIIYLAYGTVINKKDLYLPDNCIAQPTFADFPADVGLLVCHGGYAMIQLGNLLNIPIIALPLHVETFSNADHMEKLGLGVSVGSFNKENFRGGYEKFYVDWSKFEKSVDDIGKIRSAPILKDIYTNSEELISIQAIDLINKLT